MILKGQIWKDKKQWLIEVPDLDIVTQGNTKNDAYSMIRDAIESLVNKEGFVAQLRRGERNEIYIGANNEGLLSGLMLKRQREKHKMSVREMAKKLGNSSPNNYAQYESGKNIPSFEMISQFMSAMDSKIFPVLTLVKTKKSNNYSVITAGGEQISSPPEESYSCSSRRKRKAREFLSATKAARRSKKRSTGKRKPAAKKRR